jgi:hypothetical protein
LIGLLDIAERANNGPRMTETEWNMSLFKKMQELKKRHNLETNAPEKFYEVDNSYADAIFEAAVSFLSEMGIYCVSRNRVLKVTEDEVREAVREVPGEISVGSGRDRRILKTRAIEDTSCPNILAGGHSAWSEDLIPLPIIVREMVRIPRVDALECFNFVKIDGREVNNPAIAAYAARRAIERVREGIVKAGRPGLAIAYYPILTDTATLIAPIGQERGIRNTDGLLLSVLPDLKVEMSMIAATTIYEEIGAFRNNGNTFGWARGFCGGWEGAMIEAACKVIVGWMIYRDTTSYTPDIALGMEVHTIEGAKIEERPSPFNWRNFAVAKALKRHGKFIFFSSATGLLGPMDSEQEKRLLSIALAGFSETVQGYNLHFLWTPPPSYISWGIEASDAALKTRMKLADVEELGQRMVKEKLKGPTTVWNDPRQLLYQDPQTFYRSLRWNYDYIAQKPTNEFLEVRRGAKKYLEGLGVEFVN